MSFQQQLFSKFQKPHPGHRLALFECAIKAINSRGSTSLKAALYPGSFVDVHLSLALPDAFCCYVDMDKNAAKFFADKPAVGRLLREEGKTRKTPEFHFVQADYRKFRSPRVSYDLLVSMYAGPISEYGHKFIRKGGFLLVNPSHGDAHLASTSRHWELIGALIYEGDEYTMHTENLNRFLEPKNKRDADAVTRSDLISKQKPFKYKNPAEAYLFIKKTEAEEEKKLKKRKGNESTSKSITKRKK